MANSVTGTHSTVKSPTYMVRVAGCRGVVNCFVDVFGNVLMLNEMQ